MDVQYTNSTQCYQYLTQNVRFGKAYELGQNTLLCRMVHQNMVPFRPSVHWYVDDFLTARKVLSVLTLFSPHIGPSGGGYCVDNMTYVETVNQEYFNIPFIPYGYGSKN